MWFNTRAVSNEHIKFAECDRALFQYTSLEHSSGEVRIQMTGKKSGYEIHHEMMTTRRHFVDQGATLKINFEFSASNSFPDLKCGRCPYLTNKTSISTSDPDYLAHIIEVVGTKYDMSAISAKLSHIMDDWLNLDSRDICDDVCEKTDATSHMRNKTTDPVVDTTVVDAHKRIKCDSPPVQVAATAVYTADYDAPISLRTHPLAVKSGVIKYGVIKTGARPIGRREDTAVHGANGKTLSSEREERFPLHSFVAEEIFGILNPKKHFGRKRMRPLHSSD